MLNKYWKDIGCPEEGNSVFNGPLIIKLLFKKLTARQRLICNLLDKGNSYANVARILKIDPTSVRDHIKFIRMKAREAIRESFKNGKA